MEGDSVSQFLNQGGGAVLRLIIMTIVLGVLWLISMSVVVWRRNERKRRERAGQAPLPNIFAQIWGVIQQTTSPQPGQSRSSATMSMQFAQSGGHVPLPDMDDLTSDLPEPDLDFLTGGLDVETGAHLPPPVVTREELHSLVEEIEAQDDEEPMSEMEPAGEMPSRSVDSEYVPGSNHIPSDAVEVMRVWRDVSDGALIVQMADKVFQSVPEMQDLGKAKRFINVVSDLARMAQVGAQGAGLAPPNFETTSAVISQQGSWADKKRPVSPAPTPVAENPPEGDAVRANQEEKKPSGIADQIEELLQFRLMQTPIFQHRSIHVRPYFDGSIRIQVDDYFYENVDEIVDVDVREFIQRVIREWEARQ